MPVCDGRRWCRVPAQRVKPKQGVNRQERSPCRSYQDIYISSRSEILCSDAYHLHKKKKKGVISAIVSGCDQDLIRRQINSPAPSLPRFLGRENRSQILQSTMKDIHELHFPRRLTHTHTHNLWLLSVFKISIAAELLAATYIADFSVNMLLSCSIF